MRLVTPLLALATLAACSSGPPPHQVTLDDFKALCSGYGFQDGTPQMADCMERSVDAYRAQVMQEQALQQQRSLTLGGMALQNLQFQQQLSIPRTAGPIGTCVPLRTPLGGVQCY